MYSCRQRCESVPCMMESGHDGSCSLRLHCPLPLQTRICNCFDGWGNLGLGYRVRGKSKTSYISHVKADIEREREREREIQGKANTTQARRDIDTYGRPLPSSFCFLAALLPLHHSFAAPSSRRSKFGRPREHEEQKHSIHKASVTSLR